MKKGTRHFRQRWQQRVGVPLQRYTHSQLVQKIRGNQLEFVRRQSHTRTLWRFPMDGRVFILVYNKRLQQIVTVWEEGCGPR